MANSQFNSSSKGGFNIIPALLIGIVVLFVLFTVAKFVFNILYWLSPVLLIITLFIDHKVVVNYGKWILELMGKNVLLGVGLSLLTIVAFPVVSLFLFGKAILKKKVKEMTQQFEQQTQGTEEEFTEYEEVTPEDEGMVELPPPPVRQKPKQTRDSRNEYEDLFD